MDDRGSSPGRDGDGIYSLCHSVWTDSEVHPASYPMGTGVKRPGREAHHSPKSSVEVTSSRRAS